MVQKQSHCQTHSGVGFNPPGRAGFFNRKFSPGIRRDDGAKPQLLVSVPNKIRLLDGNIKPGGPFGAFG